MKPYKCAAVLMTALVPHLGHKQLIQFALQNAENVYVIVSSRSFEPIDGWDRIGAFAREFEDQRTLYLAQHHDDKAPQNPPKNGEDPKPFWDYWANVVFDKTKHHLVDVIIASEPYGAVLANHMGVDFVPYDLNRKISNFSSTDIRTEALEENFYTILPSIRKKLITNVVLFGPESVGKTTMANELTYEFNSYYIPEWARPYLELKEIGPQVTGKKMKTIYQSQLALERHVHHNITDKMFRFFDTDILSTMGYMMLWDESFDIEDIDMNDLHHIPKDIYILMNDQIPFTPDLLRYGGNKRETDNAFWVDILEKLNLPYYVVKSVDKNQQTKEIVQVVEQIYETKTKAIREFVRE